MSSQWSEENWDALMQKAVQHRMASAPETRREAQWRRIREHLAAHPRRSGWVRLGPWSFSRLGLATYCLMLVIVVAPLAFSQQLTDFSHRLFTPLALQEQLPAADKAGLAAEDPTKRLALERAAPDGKGGAEIFGVGGGPDVGAPVGAPQPEPAPMLMAVPDPAAADGTAVETQEQPPGLDPQAAADRPAVRHGLTAEEVMTVAPYARFPRLLPEQFKLADITYEAHSTETGKVILFYEHPDGKYLRVEQQKDGDPGDQPLVPSGVIEPVIVRGYAGKIVMRGEEWSDLRWTEGNVAFRMWGQLSPQQMREIAEAL